MVKNAQTQSLFFVGTSGWTYDHWKGCFYPDTLPKSHWFDFYANQFSSVEINATFYRTFKDQTYQKWKERAPQGFGYVLKAPRLITHRKFLIDVEELERGFYYSCALLGEKFELILLQVAPQTPYNPERLHKALLAFPDPGKVAVEFRHPDWYRQEILEMLRNIGTTICNVDSPRQKITNYLTSDKAYLRLHGRNHWYSYNYSNDELLELAELARELARRGANRVYVFFNNDFEGYAPANANVLKHMLP
jgi:uncharacterized protein YecE (DUF72 family)